MPAFSVVRHACISAGPRIGAGRSGRASLCGDRTGLRETDPSTAGTTASSAAASYPSVQPSGDPAREFTFPEEGRAALDTLLAGYEGVSVFYQDVGSGAVYEYRSLEKYPAASVVKAPYCLYVLDLASQGPGPT